MNEYQLEVGGDLGEDCRRARILRKEIGWEHPLIMDANQIWVVDEAIANIRQLAEIDPYPDGQAWQET